MYAARSFLLTEGEFNYLLAVKHLKLTTSNLKHYVVVEDLDGLLDVLLRLKGHYENFNEDIDLRATAYKCFISYSIEPFRKIIIP